MTLEQKLRYLEENHPDIYDVLCMVIPKLVVDPSSPTVEDLDHYNFWIDTIDIEEAQPLYHYI